MTSFRTCRSTLCAGLLVALACGGCATEPPSPTSGAPASPPPSAPPPPAPAAPPVVLPPPVTAMSELADGIKSYEDGDHAAAARRLQAALDLGLAAPADQARAHKYLAFLVCVNGREKPCRDEFRKALEADPDFALAPAEASHPVWSQVVRSVKAEIAAAAAKAKKAAAAKPAAKPAAKSTPPKPAAAPATKSTPPKPAAAPATKPAAAPAAKSATTPPERSVTAPPPAK